MRKVTNAVAVMADGVVATVSLELIGRRRRNLPWRIERTDGLRLDWKRTLREALAALKAEFPAARRSLVFSAADRKAA